MCGWKGCAKPWQKEKEFLSSQKRKVTMHSHCLTLLSCGSFPDYIYKLRASLLSTHLFYFSQHTIRQPQSMIYIIYFQISKIHWCTIPAKKIKIDVLFFSQRFIQKCKYWKQFHTHGCMWIQKLPLWLQLTPCNLNVNVFLSFWKVKWLIICLTYPVTSYPGQR